MAALGNRRDRVSTALLLAAGTGSRLQPLTDDTPKCLTMVNGKTILERLIMVVEYLDHCIREYLSNLNTDLSIEYVSNPRYRTTNNIYSLYCTPVKVCFQNKVYAARA